MYSSLSPVLAGVTVVGRIDLTQFEKTAKTSTESVQKAQKFWVTFPHGSKGYVYPDRFVHESAKQFWFFENGKAYQAILDDKKAWKVV